jgi:hypothetical protein
MASSNSESALVALVKSATPEDLAALRALLAPPKKARSPAKGGKAAASPPVAVSTEGRPDLPEPVELDDDEDRCCGRLAKPLGLKLQADLQFRATYAEAGATPSEKSYFLPGFGSKIYLEVQCSKAPVDGETLCTTCSARFAKYEDGEKSAKCQWFGIVGEAPPEDAHIVGSKWAAEVYATGWGKTRTPRSSPSASPPKKASVAAAGSPAAAEPVAPPAPKKAPRAKKEEVVPPPAPALAPAPAAEAPPAEEMVYLEQIEAWFRPSDRALFGSIVDPEILKAVPDKEDLMGHLKPDVDPKDAAVTDVTPPEDKDEDDE